METSRGQLDWTYSTLLCEFNSLQFSAIRAASMVLRRPNYNRPSYDNLLKIPEPGDSHSLYERLTFGLQWLIQISDSYDITDCILI